MCMPLTEGNVYSISYSTEPHQLLDSPRSQVQPDLARSLSAQREAFGWPLGGLGDVSNH